MEKNINLVKNKLGKNIFNILKGTFLAMIISLLLSFILALILTYTNISEVIEIPILISIVGISILIGSIFSTKHIKKNGLLNGAIVGISYVIILYVISSLCKVGFSITGKSIIISLIGMLMGTIGGIIGVNLTKSKGY